MKKPWGQRRLRRVAAASSTEAHDIQTPEEAFELQQERAYQRHLRRSSSNSSDGSTQSIADGTKETLTESHVNFLTTETPSTPPKTQPIPITNEYYAGTGEGRWDHQDFTLICFATVNNFANLARKVNVALRVKPSTVHSEFNSLELGRDCAILLYLTFKSPRSEGHELIFHTILSPSFLFLFFYSFPSLCRENGGVYFMLIYAFLEITLALPITYMEMIIGQFTKSALVNVWRLCPLFQGIGITLVILIFGFTMFFPVLVSWFLHYAILSLSDTYVWGTCNNDTNTWNTPQCVQDEDTDANRSVVRATEEYYRINIVGEMWDVHDGGRPFYSPTNLGRPSGSAMAYVILIYVIVLLVISFGPRVLGRAVHVSTAFPTVFLMILAFRGATLPGAYQGLVVYCTPQNRISKVLSPSTWRNAVAQVVSSTQCGQGYYTTYASYNQFRRPILRYAVTTICLDLVFSFVGGFTVFSYLGYSGYRRHKPVFLSDDDHVAGETIMYELMPEAFSRIPRNSGGNVMAFVFFIMIFLNTVDNLALMIDILTTSVTEIFQDFFNKFSKARSVVIFLTILCLLILNTVFTTPGGVYLIPIFSAAFGGGTNYLICSLLMLFSITCVFGAQGMKFALIRMTGNSRGFSMFRIGWVAYCLPVIGLLVFLSALGDFSGTPLSYRDIEIRGGKWTATILTYASLLSVPICMGISIFKSKSAGITSKLLEVMAPEHERFGRERSLKSFKCPCAEWCKKGNGQDIFKLTYENATKHKRLQMER